MSQALIFGINGQDGYYLKLLLEQKGYKVTGISRSTRNGIKGNVGDATFVDSVIRDIKPGLIFHLAANSRTDHSLIYEHQQTIVNGTLNIFESVYRHSSGTKVFVTGSGLQFVNNGSPIHEKTAFAAIDAYSLARIQSVYIARYYRRKGIPAYVGYLFHHDSPLRSSSHLNKRILETAFAAYSGKESSLTVGDIFVEKEFGFAGDIADGICQLVHQQEIQEACIGTGKAYPIKRWIELCFDLAGKDWTKYIQSKDDYIPEFRRLVSDTSTMASIGWQARTSMEDLAGLMFHSLSK